MKYFIITVDTEGDNLWSYKQGDTIGTDCIKYIPRFQAQCEKYGFKPVYLTNYEMLCSDEYIEFAKSTHAKGLCEIGLHLHAWNNPPYHKLPDIYGGNPYLIEYPEEVMRQKFDVLYNLFCNRLGFMPTSHRAGRWAMNDLYFNILKDYNIKVDCSVTPLLNWSRIMGATTGGSNYQTAPKNIYDVDGVLEVPLTIRISHRPVKGSFLHRIKTLIKGRAIQLRPASCTVSQMKSLVDTIAAENDVDYLEFMLHSSELMPGGSPYFPDEDSINRLYQINDSVFSYAKAKGYSGITLHEYYTIKHG